MIGEIVKEKILTSRAQNYNYAIFHSYYNHHIAAPLPKFFFENSSTQKR
jgi:hypothetical protein